MAEQSKHKTKYIKRIADLLVITRPRLGKTHVLKYGNVFGALAATVNGQIFISSGTFGLALKLPPKLGKKLLSEKGVKHLKYFKKGHVKKDYVVLPKRILLDQRCMKRLVDASIRFVGRIS